MLDTSPPEPELNTPGVGALSQLPYSSLKATDQSENKQTRPPRLHMHPNTTSPITMMCKDVQGITCFCRCTEQYTNTGQVNFTAAEDKLQ